MNTDRTNVNTFKYIKNTYDKKTLHLATVLERNIEKQTRFKSHLRFCHDSKRLKILPRFLQMKPPINHPRANEIARHAGWSYLRLIISSCHHKIDDAKKTAQDIQRNISGRITQNELATLMETMSQRNQRMEFGIRSRHQQKFTRNLHNKHEEQQCETTKRRWVVNTSNRNLDANEISLLRKGMNFAVTPKYVPVKEIITAVEQSISNLPRDAKEEVRSDVSSILK